MALLATALAVPPLHVEANVLYGFTDQRGVAHFSDRPVDARYKRLSTASVSPSTISRRDRSAQPSHTLRTSVVRIANEYGIDPALGLAIVEIESGFDTSAQSPKGALGLMQLMPETAARYGVGDPLDAESNLHGGLRYLRDLLSLFGSIELALAAYNAGEGAVICYGKTIPPFSETQAYVPKVLARYERLRKARIR